MHTGGGDRTVTALAARQHGVVTTQQLAEAGLGRRSIAHRVQQGRLKRLHRGVYLVASLPAPLTPQMAAVLACGATAVLSHHAAAALWGVRPPRDGAIDVTVATGRHRKGIRVHRRQLEPSDVTRHHGIPATTPARTLFDLAAVLPQRDLDRAVEQAQVLGLVRPRALLERHPHRALQQALQQEPALTRSEAETRLLALIRAADLPAPQTNVRVHGHEVDFYWPEHRLVVEVDGYAFHGTRQAFERDRLRDGHLQARGIQVSRITWRQIAYTPEALLVRLAATMATR
jgi:very-short-patch-repair endonuclease